MVGLDDLRGLFQPMILPSILPPFLPSTVCRLRVCFGTWPSLPAAFGQPGTWCAPGSVYWLGLGWS